ncbi:MAG: type II toxin-antitoxin system Phd/YefM family antitoxin [Aulosira sp. ZfuVER01]|nr:type II toxin-antitoxin system Phd/YefM family antitoxin [Aulosira sp. ZfuVER01]MDZ7997339.1 type II toxin-antitoxin system Phd/YefM family antitoxin [Aulosira sp. DedVER01a]MDZ8054172.1 type II toxin-antitoxin system Phd/YefM family antitoxin [Aulosira sp. ZfuCHP01]
MSVKVTSAEANGNLEKLCSQVLETGEAVIISQVDGKNVVLIAEAELNSLLETLYLLRSPANSTRLLTALERAKAGIIEPQNVDELYDKFGLNDDATDSDIVAAS